MAWVYLIHQYNSPSFMSHYIGYTCRESPDDRLAEHKAGKGSIFLQRANKLGIDYEIVRLWECNWKIAKKIERKLKAQKSAPKFCPVCNKNYLKFGNYPECNNIFPELSLNIKVINNKPVI